MAEDALEPSTAGVTDNASCQELDALNVNAASADDLHSVGGLAKPMANRIVELRGATGQFLSFDDLHKRVNGLGKGKVEKLQEAGFHVLPTVRGLLQCLDALTQEDLIGRGLSPAAADVVLAVRQERKGRPYPSVDRARRQLKAATWHEAVGVLLGGEDALRAGCRLPESLEAMRRRKQQGDSVSKQSKKDGRGAESAKPGEDQALQQGPGSDGSTHEAAQQCEQQGQAEPRVAEEGKLEQGQGAESRQGKEQVPELSGDQGQEQEDGRGQGQGNGNEQGQGRVGAQEPLSKQPAVKRHEDEVMPAKTPLRSRTGAKAAGGPAGEEAKTEERPTRRRGVGPAAGSKGKDSGRGQQGSGDEGEQEEPRTQRRPAVPRRGRGKGSKAGGRGSGSDDEGGSSSCEGDGVARRLWEEAPAAKGGKGRQQRAEEEAAAGGSKPAGPQGGAAAAEAAALGGKSKGRKEDGGAAAGVVSGAAAGSGAAVGSTVDPGTSKEARMWWRGDVDGMSLEGAPFPPEFNDVEASDGDKRSGRRNGKGSSKRAATAWCFLYAHIDEESVPGEVWYNGRQITHAEAKALRQRWSAAYPALPSANERGNGREGLAQRSKTSGEELRRHCWQQLAYLEEADSVPELYRSWLRVDPYGNVVSIDAAASGSLCGFQADHLFPWSRGGLTVPDNLGALHWKANILKSDALLHANERDGSGVPLTRRLFVGLSVEQLAGLYSIRQQAPSIADRRKFDRLLRQLLCEPYSLPSKANGQPFLRTLEPGWPTYDFLHGSYVAGMQDLWGRLRPIKGGDGDGDEGGDSDGEH